VSLDFLTNEEIVHAARRNMSQGTWDYLVGGAESETTMRRNRLAFDRLAFRPRALVDVSGADASTTLLGQPMRIPVMLAPVGSLQRFDPTGGVASTKAAAQFGTIHTVSSVTQPELEETAAAGANPKIYQLYIHGDWAWVEDRVERAKAAGYVALAMTVDTAVYSRRERPMLDRWFTPLRDPASTAQYTSVVTWETVDRIKELAGLPFVLKGIGTAEDAALAVDHGVDVVWVSNHGGRQLDHGRGTMTTLPEIVQAVDGRAEVVLDGGVQRGTDVLKAVALGAKAVAIGKLQGWGLAAGGPEGLVRVLEILEDEILVSMGLLGVTSMAGMSRDHVCADEPVTLPHETSAWVNMGQGRAP
jgi:glycolate oxidase